MAPTAALPAGLQDIPTTESNIYPPIISDSNLTPSFMTQTQPTIAPIYAVGLVLIAVLAVSAWVLLVTRGKKLRLRFRKDKERGNNEENADREIGSKPELRGVQGEEKYQTIDYPLAETNASIFDYHKDLHYIAKGAVKAEELTIGDGGYTTGLTVSDSMASLPSVSSLTSFKSEEDIAEAEFHAQVVARRPRKWAGPGEDLYNQDFNANVLLSSAAARDSLRLGWEVAGDEKSVAFVEVRRAVSQNIEMAKARLVSVILPPSRFPSEGTVSLGESSNSSDPVESGYNSSCSSLSSIARFGT